MILQSELIRWLKTLPEDTAIWIDEGALMLCTDASTEGGNAYLEIGGEPDESE